MDSPSWLSNHRETYYVMLSFFNQFSYPAFEARMVIMCILITGEAGWTPDQWGHSRFKMFNASAESATNQKHLTAFMRSLLKVGSYDKSFSALLSIDFHYEFLVNIICTSNLSLDSLRLEPIKFSYLLRCYI